GQEAQAWSIRKSNARSYVLPGGLGTARIVASRISGIVETGWSCGKYRGRLSRNEAVSAQPFELTVVEGRIDLPSCTVCKGKVVAELPLVLTIHVVLIGVGVNHATGTLPVRVRIAKQEIQSGIAGRVLASPTEGKRTVVTTEEWIVYVETPPFISKLQRVI